MRFVLDYPSPRTDLHDVRAAGVEGVVRYVSRTPAKNITKAEYLALQSAGLDLALVWETTQTRTSAGRDGGLEDGKAASAQADAIGYPPDHVIYWAVDEAEFELTDVEAYGRGFAQACRWVARPYGNDVVVTEMVTRGVADAGWQCQAWSLLGTRKLPAGHRTILDGKQRRVVVSPHAVLFQKSSGVKTTLPGNYDENEVLRSDWASTTGDPKTAATRMQEDDDMLDRRFMQARGHGEVYLVHPLGDFGHHIPNEGDIAQVVYAVEHAGGRILDPPDDAEVSILANGTKVWIVDPGVLAAFTGQFV